MNLSQKEQQVRDDRRESVMAILKSGIITPISMEAFAKNEAEKSQLKDAKKQHRKHLKSHGFNSKKRINVSEPGIMHYRI